MSTCIAPPARLSVHEDCVEEANRYKWIESEKAGRDLGEQAILNWVRSHWNGYLRNRWLEHLEGLNFWIELDHDDFGLLRNKFQDSTYVSEIVRQLKEHGENLSIILWALDNSLPMDSIFDILLALNINSKRIECQLVTRLCNKPSL